MREGDVILTPVPQADGRLKYRLTVILREMLPFQDWLVCGISSQIQQEVSGFDEVISPEDEDFAASGLRVKSLIRLGFLPVVPRREVPGSIGSVSVERHRRLLQQLSRHLLEPLEVR